ncbi:HlyD family secretion protein [Clostridium neuense]|uniref:HlyD family secretion protein n=1 Tax=Clostridium neuense TaxID=1728934 RepID=A0ABW8TI13_9CLOT
MKNKKMVFALLGIICFSLTACGTKTAYRNKYTGTVECRSSYITSEVSGKVDKLNIEEGNKIRKDDAIATINSDAYKIQKNQAEGSLETAKANFDSLPDGVDDNKKKQVEGSVKQAQATLDLVNLNISKCDIKSYQSGVVSDVLVHEGEMVQQGGNIAKVLDTDSRYIKIYVEQSKRHDIKLKDNLNLYYNDKKVGTGEVIFISPQTEFTPKNTETKEDKQGMVFEVRVKLSNNLDYTPGTLMDVEVK